MVTERSGRRAAGRRAATTARLAALALALGSGLAACATDAEAPGDSGPPSATPTGATTAEPSPSPSATAGTSTGAGADVAAELTVTVDETGMGAARTTTLTCDPVGGDHPDAEAACATLATVGAAAFDAPPADVMCTQQYGGPQVATVEGTVAGTPVSTSFARSDGCEISRWDALVPLLPEAGGGM